MDAWTKVAYHTWPDRKPVTKGEVWIGRAQHPSWWPRLLRGWLRLEWLWRVQGKPTDVPVILQVGRLITVDGKPRSLEGWHFDCGKQAQGFAIDPGYLWYWLAVRYPETVGSH